MLLPPDATPAQRLEQGRAVLAQQPFSVLLGTQLHTLTADAVELHLPLTDKIKQQHGFAHGGVVSYLADNALTYAGGYAMNTPVVTSELKVNYLRPALGDLLIARARAIHAGQSQAVCRCEIYAVKDGAEKLCAAAQGTIVRMGSASRSS